MSVESNNNIAPKMEKSKTRSMSNIQGNGNDSRTGSVPSGLRRITSLNGSPRQRIPRETLRGGDTSHTNGGSSSGTRLRRIASTPSRVLKTKVETDSIQNKETLSKDSLKSKGISRSPSVIRLRRIASKSSRIFRSNVATDSLQGGETHTNGGISSSTRLRRVASKPSRIMRKKIDTEPVQSSETLCEDSMKGKEIRRMPSVVRLRRMASMPARSLKRMASRSIVRPQDSTQSGGSPLSRMKSWSGSGKSGSTRWFGFSHREKGISRLGEPDAPSRGTRPARHVHFATAELRPDFGSESSEEDNLSSYHVSLLPSRRHVDEIRDGGDRQSKWWRNDEYYAALAMPIF